jgi:hypothetical protein
VGRENSSFANKCSDSEAALANVLFVSRVLKDKTYRLGDWGSKHWWLRPLIRVLVLLAGFVQEGKPPRHIILIEKR